jgi:hypothetical protein
MLYKGRPARRPKAPILVTRLMQAVVQEGTGRIRPKPWVAPPPEKPAPPRTCATLWFVGYRARFGDGRVDGIRRFHTFGQKADQFRNHRADLDGFHGRSRQICSRTGISPCPPGIVFSKIDRDTGFLGACPPAPNVVLEGFREGLAPTVFCPTNHDAEEPPLDQDVTE